MTNKIKRSEIVRKLKKAGWKIISGGKHGMAVHPNEPGKRIPIPHGSKIDYWTAKGILQEAGLS